jgi:threonine/homoserine/homoserine lactone efflux protein
MLGLLLSVLVGPAFFVLIETSISKGVRSAVMMDIGILLSDLMYIALAFFFASGVASVLQDNDYISYIGGGIFIIFGLYSFLKKKPAPQQTVKAPTGLSQLKFTAGGFALNSINPSVLAFWVAMVILARTEYGYDDKETVLFFACALLTFFAIDILKIYSARKLKKFLSPQFLVKLNKVTGIILLLFGIVLIIRGI